MAGKEETELPVGWEWQEDWNVDLNRAVDEEGKNSFNTRPFVRETFIFCKLLYYQKCIEIIKTRIMWTHFIYCYRRKILF